MNSLFVKLLRKKKVLVLFLCSEFLFTGACGRKQKLGVKTYRACQSIAGEPADLLLSVCQLFPLLCAAA